MTDNTQNKQSSIPEAFTHESYLVRRKMFKLFGAAFHIYDPNGRVVFYSKMKTFKLKEAIRLYTGEDMQTENLTILARKIINFSAAYDVINPATNKKVGVLKRKRLKLKDEWIIMDAKDREIGFIKASSALLALIRRLSTKLIPQKYYGELKGNYGELKGKKVCLFKENFNPIVMKINLDFSMDRKGLLDRRLGIAAAVLLCAIDRSN